MVSNKRKSSRFDFPWKPFLAILSVFILIGLVMAGRYFHRQYRLSNEGVETVGLINHVSLSPYVESRGGNVTLSFDTKDGTTEQHMYVKYNDSHTEAIAPNGMPLKGGDRFKLTYLPDDPSIFEVHFDQPLDKTVSRYLSVTGNALQQYQLKHQREPFYRGYCNCMVQGVYHSFGLKGLANIRFHDKFFLLNWKNNSWRHANMVKHDAYKELEERCSMNISMMEVERGRKSIYD